jgi:acyl-CoA reductase-like NAD-dependent aldehyde dehydrogenase
VVPLTVPGDYHVHTKYSDGEVTVVEGVAHAIAVGLPEIGSADHLSPVQPTPWETGTIPFARLERYAEEVQGVAARHGEIAVRLGVEADYVPEHEAELAELLSAYPLESVVGGGQMGPAVSADQLATDLEYVQIARDEGAELLAGGARAGDGGRLVQPTVFDGVDVHSRLAQEEVFGPVIDIIRARDLEAALSKANAVGCSLAANVVTNDVRRALTFVDRFEAGVIKVNEPTTGLALQALFGGYNLSSANTLKEQGPAALEFYERTKTVHVTS